MAAKPSRPARTRIPVAKTCKMYVGGKFVRSEGGHVLDQFDAEGEFMAHTVRATRKDLRDAVVAARKAQGGWAAASPFLRSQILYRLAEMLEDRRALFVERLSKVLGDTEHDAEATVSAAVDRVFWYAGWCDKFAPVLGAVNPVAAPFFNFSTADPTGVVVVIPSENSPLLGLVSAIAPVILSGNACVVLVDNAAPILASDLGEALAVSDLPGGVVNLLTGQLDELLPHAASHMDVQAVACFGGTPEQRTKIREAGAENVKRVAIFDDLPRVDWLTERGRSLYWIEPFIEWKTAWHPIRS